MAEYQRTRLILAPPDEVFAFATDLNTLPAYLPTVQVAEPEAEGRIRIRGEVDGRPYVDDGDFRVDAARRRMEWSADERNYAGWLSVSGEDGGSRSQVTVHLSVAPWTDPSGAPIGEPAIGPDPTEERLEAALDSLRDLVEGRDGKAAGR